MMNITSDYYRTREGCPEVHSDLAERWIRTVRGAAEVFQLDQADRSQKPLRPSAKTLRRMKRRFKH